MATGSSVLKSELAGVWYTEDPKRLAREIDVYLDAVDRRIGKDIMAVLLPHAGYRYSGMVAANGVKQVAGREFSRVIVIGPSHRMALMDSASMPDVDAIETPLGRIDLDRPFMEKLWKSDRFRSHLDAHASEHSVQIELPFLQRALRGFKLVPIVCGELCEASARQIARTLRENMDSQTLVVISSDFTHYGRGFSYMPFKHDIQGNLEALDMGAFRLIEERNLKGFLEYVRNTGATICGRSPIAILLAMLPDDAGIHLLKYDTSGNLTGDWSHCVSYVSAAITGRWPEACDDGLHCERRHDLTESDKEALLRLARHSIVRRLRKNEPDSAPEITAPMQEIMGAFVTLHKGGQLRGCIGEIFPRRELYEAVREQAVNAAFHDPRFPRLHEKELEDIDIEISALTVPHRVNSYSDIEIGRHGVVLYKGSHSAVFLPQVALEQGWDLAETLTHLAMKAGLAPDVWHDGCEFHVFEAIVFGEASRS
jgi:AmmeMemoRadiSam system protein B/AmmeMemoRadiSam system protein A